MSLPSNSETSYNSKFKNNKNMNLKTDKKLKKQ